MSEVVVAVVVTYNRRELLGEALAALAGQTRLPDRILVVDNASTDGTAELVHDAFPEVELHRLPRNTGGAGGFAYGIDSALRIGADLVWLMDDDTVPDPMALAELLHARQRYPGPRPTLIASRVVWTDGRVHPMNTPRPRPMVGREEQLAASAIGCVPIRSASFVSVLVEADACRRRGLPMADYFIWNDDFEFTTRLLRGGIGLLCPDSIAVHATRGFGATDVDPGERFFYEVRNKVWLLTRSDSLAPAERVLYGGATLRRWVRTIGASQSKGRLVRGLLRGLVAGFLRSPRPTTTVLAGILPS